MTRPIITTIDSIVAILKDYCKSEDLPEDTMAVKLFVNPAERRKIGILVESSHFKDAANINLHFDLKRFYGPTKTDSD